MKVKLTFIIIILICISCSNLKQYNESPNFVFILADDLGYGELGAFGQKIIETPNIDKLAKDGMILTNHYSGSPVCAPARAVLLTGLHTGNNPVRGNDEWRERGDVWSFQEMFKNPDLEGQRPMPDSTITIANYLKSNGYKTGMVGSNVKDFKTGDRVSYAGAPLGSYSTHRNYPTKNLVKVPDNISFKVAATLMTKGLTTFYLLHKTFPVKSGQTILYHAAAGGVGQIFGQWAKSLGCTVIGTVGSDEKVNIAKE